MMQSNSIISAPRALALAAVLLTLSACSTTPSSSHRSNDELRGLDPDCYNPRGQIAMLDAEIDRTQVRIDAGAQTVVPSKEVRKQLRGRWETNPHVAGRRYQELLDAKIDEIRAECWR